MSLTASNRENVRFRLLARRRELIARERRVERDLRRTQEPLAADFADQAVQVQNDETLQGIGQAALEEVGQIDSALERLQRGSYGICTTCGAPIDARRLAAVPQAATCSTCRPAEL